MRRMFFCMFSGCSDKFLSMHIRNDSKFIFLTTSFPRAPLFCKTIISVCMSFRDAQKRRFSTFEMIVIFVFLQLYFSKMYSSTVYVKIFFAYIRFEHAQKKSQHAQSK